MRSRIEIGELVDVLEEICNKEYPDIPADLIRNIVNVEFDNQAARSQGRKKTKKFIDDFLKTCV